MNKQDLVKVVSLKARMSEKDTRKVLDAFVDTIIERVGEGEKVTVIGFGTFEARDRSERAGRNPQTGEPLTIAATTVPAFSAGKVFKEKVKPD